MSCAASDGTDTSSSVRFFDASRSGALRGGCILVRDLDTPTGGYWLFERSGTTRMAEYKDTGSAWHLYELYFTASECTVIDLSQ